MPTPEGMFFPMILHRFSGDARNEEGRDVTPTDSTSDIVGSLQPSPGRADRFLDRGISVSDVRLLITPERDIRVATEGANAQLADQIEFNGELFTVLTAEPWDFLDIEHGEYVVGKLRA